MSVSGSKIQGGDGGGSKNVSAPPCLKNVTYIFEVIPREITHEASKM